MFQIVSNIDEKAGHIPLNFILIFFSPKYFQSIKERLLLSNNT